MLLYPVPLYILITTTPLHSSPYRLANFGCNKINLKNDVYLSQKIKTKLIRNLEATDQERLEGHAC